jgi:hypothetical protein
MSTIKEILDLLSFTNSLYLVSIITCLSMIYVHTKNKIFQIMVEQLGIKISLIEFKARFLTFALLYSIVYGIAYLITIFG